MGVVRRGEPLRPADPEPPQQRGQQPDVGEGLLAGQDLAQPVFHHRQRFLNVGVFDRPEDGGRLLAVNARYGCHD